MGTHPLVSHPATPASSVRAVDVQVIDFTPTQLVLEFAVWPGASLAVPPGSSAARTDGLWRTTCFEAFLKREGADCYYEFNCSPALAWAAYRFARYREGMSPLELPLDPVIEPDREEGRFYLYTELDTSMLGSGPARIGLAAVIEEADGTKSYWALAHPPGEPDFHHPDCFALELWASPDG